MNGTDTRRFVPLKKIVHAALLDSYAEKGQSEDLYYHFAARGFNKLQREIIKQGKRYTLLEVNQNTNTATLPIDFEEELFVGILGANGMKLQLVPNGSIVNQNNVSLYDGPNKCKVCNSDTSICENLQITETSNPIVINDTTYEQKVVKKLYPNGDYYQETTTPFLDTELDTIVYRTDKEFIDHISLLPCGCIENTAANMATLQRCAPDAYCCYYAACDCGKADLGTYRIFEENNLIQFDYNFHFDKVYIEYIGSMPKIKGQLSVPAVAFETLVEWIKYKSVANRKNIGRLQVDQYFESYKRERHNMEKILGRVSLASIIDAATRVPKFNVSYQSEWCGFFNWGEKVAAAVTPAEASTPPPGGGGTTTVIQYVTSNMPPDLLVNGQSFSSQGAFQCPAKYKTYDFLIYWNGFRYLTRDEYLVDRTNAIVTILLGSKPFSIDDNYILMPQTPDA